MSAGWVNLKEKQRKVREYERVMRELGYSHGYARMQAMTTDAYYQAAYRRGNQARRDFDESQNV